MIAGALASPAIVSGCYHHHDYDHDRGYAVSATWSDNESPYYSRWEADTHREHREWAQRNADEQHDYWAWRHDHHDHP